MSPRANRPTAAALDDGEIRPGDSLGRYTVQRLIGTGGMGRVYAATDSQLGRTVALKVIRGERVVSPAARPRLLREAQALALLHHPNVVTVHDIGNELDRVFIAMELVEGPTLAAWLASEVRSWRDIVRVLHAAGRGLAAAHAAGIIHRDFKPANVIVGKDRVVVVDFGLARAGLVSDDDGAPVLALGSSSHEHDLLEVNLTEHGARVGTVAYMAPEQTGGHQVTSKVDQYSFCVVLWEALWGERPVAPSEPVGDATVNRSGPLRGVPARLRDLLIRGLAGDPGRRWPTMPVLLAALERTLVRRTRIALGVGLLVAALAVGVLGWMHQSARNERRVAAAQQLAREAEIVRGHMRASRLLPLHDIEIDRQSVRAQMARITAEMAAFGEDGRGPGERALGAAWLALGDARATRKEALVHLRAAWDAGERNPELAFDLGTALVREYQYAIQHVPPMPAAERTKHEAELHRTLRDPAVAFLHQAKGADTSPDYLEALIALAEGRTDDAIAHGEAALRDVPTLYMAGVTMGQALDRQAAIAFAAGKRDEAEALFDRVEALYRRVIDIGRSDELVYHNYADILSTISHRRVQNGVDVEPELRRTLELAESGRNADSQAVWPDEVASHTYDVLAINDAHHGRDPRPNLRLAIERAERASQRDLETVKPWQFLGNAWGDLVDLWETPHGIDPRPSLEKSIAAYRTASRMAPDQDTFGNLGVSLASLARWKLAHGVDAQADIDAAVASYEDSFRMNAEDALFAHANACNLVSDLGRAWLFAGRDPAAVIARALPLCEAAKRDSPGMVSVRSSTADFATLQGLAAARTGGDPEPAWQRALVEGEAAVKAAADDFQGHSSLALTYAARADHATQHGRDAASDVARAIAEGERGAKLGTSWPDPLIALARAQLAAARAAIRAGRDPAPALRAGQDAIDRALAMNRDADQVMLTAGELALLAAARTPAMIDVGLGHLQHALALNPRNTRALALRAGFERLAGRAAAADATLRDALAAGPLLARDPAIAR